MKLGFCFSKMDEFMGVTPHGTLVFDTVEARLVLISSPPSLRGAGPVLSERLTSALPWIMC